MYVYIFLYLLILISVFYINKKDLPQKHKNSFFLCVFAVFLILALRHQSMGIDLHYGTSIGYIGSYQIIAKESLLDIITNFSLYYDFAWRKYEVCYVLLNKIVSMLSFTNVQVFLAVCVALSFFPIAKVLYKESKYPLVSLIIYLALPTFLILFSTLRQALAISICISSLKFIKEKKLIPFLLMVLLAMSFHDTAFLFVVAYPLFHIKLNKTVRYSTIGMIAFFFVFKAQLFSILARLLSKTAVPDNNGPITLFLVFLLIYILGCLVIKDDDEGLLNFFFVVCCVQAMGGVYSTVIRVGYYFMPFIAILIPNMIESIEDNRVRRILKVFVPLCFVAFGLYTIYSTTWSMSYPYKFFWS